MSVISDTQEAEEQILYLQWQPEQLGETLSENKRYTQERTQGRVLA